MSAGGVRAFTRGDIPRVAALRRRLFTSTVHVDAAASEAYFDLVFFGNPWRDLDLPSLVYEDADGQLTGFLGVIPRPMRFRGRRVRMAVTSQFMAERGAAGLRLLSRFMDGPQDLSFSDAANDASRRVWESLGGTTAVVQSLHWEIPVRPLRNELAHLGDHPAVRAARLIARPIVAAADAAWQTAAGRHRPSAVDALARAPLTPRDVAELFPTLCAEPALVPEYSEASVRWLLDRLGEQHGPDALHGRLVRDTDGAAVGWYLYERRGIVAELVQLTARAGRWRDMLQVLRDDARDDGAGAVAGRLDPRHVAELPVLPGGLRPRSFWSLMHARDPEIALALLRGDAALSRLDAEWWVNF
ncbi:MAG: hypothetical protein KGL93_00740 [Gemmatimonadota bacterium]|nr:hypothetical protein [Gemmatimonadota bacterium]